MKIILTFTSLGRVVGTEFYVPCAHYLVIKFITNRLKISHYLFFFFFFKEWCELNLVHSLIFSCIWQENIRQSILFFLNRLGEVDKLLGPCIFQQRVAVHYHTPTAKGKLYSNIYGLSLQGKNTPCGCVCFGGEMRIGLLSPQFASVTSLNPLNLHLFVIWNIFLL